MGLRVLSGSMEFWALGIRPTRISCWVGVFTFKGGKPAQPRSEKAVVRTLLRVHASSGEGRPRGSESRDFKGSML